MLLYIYSVRKIHFKGGKNPVTNIETKGPENMDTSYEIFLTVISFKASCSFFLKSVTLNNV